MYYESVRVSGSVFAHFDCTWMIPKFSVLNSKFGKKTRSKCFQLQECSLKWDLSVYPGGKDKYGKELVACYLNYGGKMKLSIKFHSFSLRNTIGETIWNVESDEWEVCKGSYGFPEIMKRNKLINELVDDVLIISISVSYCSNFVQDSLNTKYSAEVMSPMIKLTEDYKWLSTNEENADSIISVGRKIIPVHSAILSARSTVFEAMFEKDMQEKRNRQVQIKDFKMEIIKALIHFIYTGYVDAMDIEVALELIRAADKYNMKDLMLYCSNYLTSNLDDENVGEVLIKADMYKAGDLKTKTIQYFRQHRDRDLIRKHRPLLRKHPDVLLNILEANMNNTI